jgi:CRP-like cAMP-binding protein
VPEQFPQAAMVVKQGECGRAMYLIVEGELSVHLNLGGQETELATLGAGEFFGDFALFDHGPRSANVIANRTCHLWKISVEAFQQLSREVPDVALPFLRAIGKTQTARIRAGNKRQGETTLMARVLSQPEGWAAEAE